MSKFLTMETLLWVFAAVMLVGVVFNPKPLKQIASEGWAKSMSNLKWAAPVFYILGGMMTLILSALAYFTYFPK